MRQLAPISSPPFGPDLRLLPDLGAQGQPSLGGPELLPGVSIVMACSNNATTVAAAISNAAAAAALISHRYEIIVVDDGSADLTADRAAASAATDGRVQLLLHPHERGSAEALRTGLAAARHPWVVLADASLELDLCQLDDFRSLTPDHDLLLGWRVMRRGPVGARLTAALWNRLVSRRLGIPVRDVDCPLKLVRHSLLDQMDLVSHSPMLGTELLARACARGARITEVAVRQRHDACGAHSAASPRLGARNIAALAALSAAPPRATAHPRPTTAQHLRSPQ